MFQSSSVPGLPGNHLLRYLSLLISVCKQSSPACPALALGLQWVWAHCLLYGKTGLWRATLLFKPAIVFYKPETVEALLSDPELIEKGSEYKLIVPWLGTGLITSPSYNLSYLTIRTIMLEDAIRPIEKKTSVVCKNACLLKLVYKALGSGGLVVKSRRVPGYKPYSTKDPPCTRAWCMSRGPNLLPLVVEEA
ncbi:hypothetical protein AVEN_217432-1 [Araneus ventricosus]|uniref:Uncharacterized protein n=1 Tax=Araneus ventricosus TaxID=182803 RepID=A0A4Y2TTB5_ARAVE|nr:hypothetical protein AVEN_217432-1 [Araneus ventricosus]